MDDLYNFLHVAGVMLLFTAFGAVILNTSDRYNKVASILHGISLLIILISGIMILIVNGWATTFKFYHAKILILILMGGALTLAKRKIVHPPVSLSIVLALGFIAAYLGIYKPF